MKRKQISPKIAAKVMFTSDRTCCVCRKPGKPCQIHHIDGDPNNNKIDNLCVLCLDCHTETQISGGFHRKLSAEQIILYRDDWHILVAQKRAINEKMEIKEKSPDLFFKEIITEIDILKDRKKYDLIGPYYSMLGNNELRDKYIELAIKSGVDDVTHIFLRYEQGKPDLIPNDVAIRVIKLQTKNEEWSQLARTYVQLGRLEEAIKCYCKSILKDLENNNIFSSAFYLKELSNEKLYLPLFEQEYSKCIKNNDLWWQIRCLDELGWYDEIKELLLKNKKIIESSDDLLLKQTLYRYLEDEKNLLKISRIMGEKLKTRKEDGSIDF